jgi:hypothetical protein
MRRQPTASLTFVALLLAAGVLLAPATAHAAQPNDPGMVKFRGAAFPIAEEAGAVTIVDTRLRGSSGEVTVDYATIPGSATEGDDYTATAGTLTWADGDGADKTFTVEIIDDDLDEGLETFGVELSNPTGGVEISQPSTTVVHIKPSDRGDGGGGDGGGERGVVLLTSARFRAFEAAGMAEVTAIRRGNAAGPATVDFMTVPGSATEGDDYVPAAGTLSWGPGERGVKTISIELVDDTAPEDLETITVVLSNATGARLGVRDTASVVIIDDDGGAGGCIADDTTLCLLGGRYQIVGDWETPAGDTGPFHWIPSSDRSAFAWFFNDENLEFLFKMLNGCPVNGHAWVFFAATTNVGYHLEVTELATGEVRVYDNPVGTVPMPETDTTAFACD